MLPQACAPARVCIARRAAGAGGGEARRRGRAVAGRGGVLSPALALAVLTGPCGGRADRFDFVASIFRWRGGGVSILLPRRTSGHTDLVVLGMWSNLLCGRSIVYLGRSTVYLNTNSYSLGQIFLLHVSG
jgi:hypothetical protein